MKASSRAGRWLVAGLGLLLVALVSAVAAMQAAIRAAEVAVPDFRGMTAADGSRRGAALDLDLIMDNRLYSADIPAGRIVGQSPSAGSLVPRSGRVRVTESLGPRQGAIPDVTGEQEQMAMIELRRLGIDIGSTARVPDGRAPAGTVLSQSPAAGTDNTSSVGLLVSESDAAAAGGFVMPDLVGLPVTEAKAAMTRAGLGAVREVSSENDTGTVTNFVLHGNKVTGSVTNAASAPRGNVVSQSPAAGYRVDRSMEITVTVSR